MENFDDAFGNLRDYLKRFFSKPHVDARATASGIRYIYTFKN